MISIISREGKMASGLIFEVFDIMGDYGMFFGIHAMYFDTAENRARSSPVYIPAMCFLILSTLVSLTSLALRGTFTAKQMRRRRRELKLLGDRKKYMQQLRDKIDDAERTCTQTYIGIALGVFECLPMGCIGMYWFIEQYSIPWTQVVSLFTSALALGMKISSVSTLPYWWTKRKKWRANTRPVRERGVLGTELAAAAMADGAVRDDGDMATLGAGLQHLRTMNLAVARRAEQQSTPTAAAIAAKLMKMDHVLLQFLDMVPRADSSEFAPANDVAPHPSARLRLRPTLASSLEVQLLLPRIALVAPAILKGDRAPFAGTPSLTSLLVHRVGLEQPSKPKQPLTNLTALQMSYPSCSLAALQRPYSIAFIPVLADLPWAVCSPRCPRRSLQQCCSSHGCCSHDRRVCGFRPHLQRSLATAQAKRR